MLIGASIVFVLYFLSMMWIIFGFQKLKPFDHSHYENPIEEKNVGVTIVIPFRNEETHLPKLLASLAAINYPKEDFEVLLVDDESSDNGVRLIHSELLRLSTILNTKLILNCKVIPNKRVSGSPKKDAISTAIQIAKFDWIITTDADCEVPANWLKRYSQIIQTKNPKMVCGPVAFTSNSSWIEDYQFLDGLSLQAVAMGSSGWNSPLLCNGANLGYSKEAFLATSGFSGNDHLASGDDIFMLEKMKQLFPKRITFLKHEEAIVHTASVNTWSKVLTQRIRWASKTTKQKSWGAKILGAIVFLANLAVICSFVGIFLWPLKVVFLGAFIAQKLVVDILILTLVANFFKKPVPILSTIFTSLLYPIITVIVVFKSLSGSYTWKERTFKK